MRGFTCMLGRRLGWRARKAFSAGQLVVETLLALFIACGRKYMSQQVLNEFLTGLNKIPEQVRQVLQQSRGHQTRA